jgi:sigma-B regulation protein RsbU (phosphoserine phosphatase)
MDNLHSIVPQKEWSKRILTLDNDIQQIPQLASFVDAVAEEAGIDFSVAMSLNLALEEAVVNVMQYAYPVGTYGTVTIEALFNKEQLKFIISDAGVPFDPTAKEDVDVNLEVSEREVGGLGIHLIRQIMDEISYEYKDGKNYLTLHKKINQEG